MFAAQAHSFTQQARLAITLAWVAGYTNIVALITCGTAISHVTGTTSNLGRDIAERAWPLATHAFFLIATFFVGAVISGAATEHGRRRGWESIYVLPIAIEAALLAIFAIAVEFHQVDTTETGASLWLMTGIASLAMGLQNATITRISSGVVRTTHVTGVVTDLGLEGAQLLWWIADSRRSALRPTLTALLHSAPAHPALRRLALLLSIVGSFALGAGLGTTIYAWTPSYAMFPPVLFLAWLIAMDLRVPIAEIEPGRFVSDETGAGLPRTLAVHHVRSDRRRRNRTHRLPDLVDWSRRLPPEVRVLILDLAELLRLDAISVQALTALAEAVSAQQRRLIICGVKAERFDALRHDAATNPRPQSAAPPSALDTVECIPELDLAVARGLALLE